MMYWQQLITDKRLGQEHRHSPRHDDRSEFKRDYDRLIFSAPFRRLQNKTQVFPLPGSVFVHNRLTHSLEVASVGMSLGTDVACELLRRRPELASTRIADIGQIVAAACLAHDMGNPPFGHAGEKAMQTFFTEGAGSALRERLSPVFWSDITHFEGNANAFRLLTHRFCGRRPGGFVMTYTTLAAIVKYPHSSLLAGAKGKFGFFATEQQAYERIAAALGLVRLSAPGEPLRCARHPLVYLVEAADDICYQIMDIEDAHKLKILTTDVVEQLFLDFFTGERRQRIEETLHIVSDLNEQIAYLRSCVIGKLVDECSRVFVELNDELLRGELKGCLIEQISDTPRNAYKACSDIAYRYIYKASDVLDIELAGNRIITVLLDKLIDAVLNPEKAYSQLLLNKVPGQYEMQSDDTFTRIQAVIDYISGMTDVYALDLYRKINGMSLPAL